MSYCLTNKLDWNYARILPVVFGEILGGQLTKQQLNIQLRPISQTMRESETRYAVFFWGRKNALIGKSVLSGVRTVKETIILNFISFVFINMDANVDSRLTS